MNRTGVSVCWWLLGAGCRYINLISPVNFFTWRDFNCKGREVFEFPIRPHLPSDFLPTLRRKWL